MPPEQSSNPPETPLDSWKAIAAYLNRDARTVMRWEKSEGLPVHRHRHMARSSVYAYPSELDAWRANRRVLTTEPTRPRRAPRLVAVAAILTVSLMSAGGGRFRPLAAGQDGSIDRSLDWPGNARMAPSAAMSPDGRYVTYIKPKPDGDLHVRDLVEGTDRRLTHIEEAGGYVDYSAVSHDSAWVAVVGKDRDARNEPFKLYVLPLSADPSAKPRVLVDGTYAAPKEWSPDDHHLLVVVERTDLKIDIALVDAETGKLRTLRTLDRPYPGYHVRMSPDGLFVAYDHPASENVRQRDVLLIPVAGGADIPLIDDPSSDTVVGWSPDGRYLIFESDRSGSNGLWAMPVADGHRAGEPVLLKDDFKGDPLSITAQGDLFYEVLAPGFDRPKRALLMASVDFDKGTLLKAPWFAAHDRQAETRSPRWTADGRQFMYVTQRPAGPMLSIRSESGIVREVPRNLGYVWTFDWSPDGAQIVYRATDLQGRQGVFLVDATTGNVRTVVLYVQNVVGNDIPQFTADGQGVTYFKNEFQESKRPGWRSYVQWDIATGREHDVVPDLRPLMTGRHMMGRSPDGRYLLAMAGDTQTTRMFAYDTRTSTTSEMLQVDLPEAFNPVDGLRWLPDSSAFVVNTRGPKENERVLWWVPMDGRPPHKLDIGRTDLVNSAIAIHPDGHQIAFVAGDPVVSKTAVLHTEFRLLQHFLPMTKGAPTGKGD
jgi:Tol biopolymer transport system component